MTDRTVRRHIADLKAANVITTTRKCGAARAGATEHIRIVGFSDQPDAMSARSKGPTRHYVATNRTLRPDQPDAMSSNTNGYQINTPPSGLPRAARASEVNINDVLKQLVVDRPDRQRAVHALLAPIVRVREFMAPDIAHALGTIADAVTAAGTADATLAAVAKRILATRGCKVKPYDIEQALAAPAVPTPVSGARSVKAAKCEIKLTPEDVSWKDWRDHLANHWDTQQRARGVLMAQNNVLIVSSRWPPPGTSGPSQPAPQTAPAGEART
jgi:hypothetical protein